MGSTCSGGLANLAIHDGLDVNKMEVAKLSPPEQVDPLVNNSVDAAILFPLFAYYPEVLDIAPYVWGSSKFSHTMMLMVFSEEFMRIRLRL